MHAKLSSLALAVTAPSILAVGSPLDFSVNPVRSGRLAKRELTEVICGFYSSADYFDTYDRNRNNLADRGDDSNVHVDALTCNRIGCYNTSGIYVCNDQDVDLDVPMGEIIEDLDYLIEVCLRSNDDQGERSGSGSGRVSTTDRGGYNVNIGYCNGNDDSAVPPNAYGWPGPNGTPFLECGKDGQAPCPGTGCIDGSIVMENQESVQCGDYLGAGVIGPGATYTFSTNQQVGETWTAGGFLSIDSSDLAPVSVSAGFFSSFAKTTTTGSTSGLTSTCGEEGAKGDWSCGMHVRPQCFAMNGYCDTEDTGRVPWSLVAPQERSAGVGIWTAEICTCPDCNGIGQEGAPEASCELECKACA